MLVSAVQSLPTGRGDVLVEDLERVLESLAPAALAEPWDNTGRLVGRRGGEVKRVLVALDLTEDVVVEAVTGSYQAVITHHPLVFTPVRRITDSDRVGTLVTQLIAADVALFACHTNLDGAVGGLCDILCGDLGLLRTRPLVRPGAGWKKLVGFIPPESVETVSAAVFAAGAGRIGDYRDCAFEAAGTGSFLPAPGAKPHVGTVGRRESTLEVRWETMVPAARVAAAVSAFLSAHPYEEPAFDLYPLEDVLSQGGQGRIGSTRVPVPLLSLAEEIAEILSLPEVEFAGDAGMMIETVAAVTGSGGSLMEAAAAAGAHAFITGDLRYHDADRASDLGIALVVAPHGETESWALRRWVPVLRQALAESSVEVAFSTAAGSPWSTARRAAGGKAPDGSLRLFDAETAGLVESVSEPVVLGEEEGLETFVLRVDGGSRGNPGPSAIGVVLENSAGEILEELGDRIGFTTNNVAEYQALLTGMETALDRGIRRLRIMSDSLLMVRQMRQEFKVRDVQLKQLWLQAVTLVRRFDRVEIKHVPREENAAADLLVNKALDGTL
jgi:dinuclear metal center YbgI/SA1388 family protein